MNWWYREPTLTELLSDGLVKLVNYSAAIRTCARSSPNSSGSKCSA
ncbi:MAG: hypothetical protein QOI40_3306 [Alphaproteobacteria bacterium]|nr:hypothetical protein [Alphaproteobacteria bacterium]